MNPLNQRSSWPSSLVTGFIGWIGILFIGPLMFGFRAPAGTLFILGFCSAIIQIVVLRSAFFVLQMQRHLLVGIFWGSATAIGMYLACSAFMPMLQEHTWYWILIYLYIGAPVGAFLSYFYIDDKKIFDASGGQKPDTNFGRDAHWLEPFGYGAIAYMLAFAPFSDFDLCVNVLIVGIISGIAAAGASHFSPDKWKHSYFMILLIVITVGSMQGFLTGLLLRSYQEQLTWNHVSHGIIAGNITYLLTFLRGRQLAIRETKGEL